MNEDFLEKHKIIPLTPDEEEALKEELNVKNLNPILDYDTGYCTKGDGNPIRVRHSVYEILNRKKLHIICPAAKDGCGQVLLHPELEGELFCAQKGGRDVIVHEELSSVVKIASMMKTISDGSRKKFNELLKKINLRNHLK